MGIIVREIETGEITFYEKGADVVMMTIVQYNDWLEEETGNMAREGLRTLVVGKKVLTEEQYQVISSFLQSCAPSLAHLQLCHSTISTDNKFLRKIVNFHINLFPLAGFRKRVQTSQAGYAGSKHARGCGRREPRA